MPVYIHIRLSVIMLAIPSYIPRNTETVNSAASCGVTIAFLISFPIVQLSGSMNNAIINAENSITVIMLKNYNGADF